MNNSVSTTSGKTKLKIVLLGNQAVGKSSIIERYVKDVFDETSNPTVGIDFLVKNVTFKTKTYRLQLWDTAGQERFRSLIPNYLKDAKCAIVIVDITSRSSLQNIQSWVSLYNENKIVQGFVFLVGNKIDLQNRQFSEEQARKKAEQLQIPYFEVSAKQGQNIESLFTKVIEVSQDPNHQLLKINKTEQNSKSNQIKESNEEEEQENKGKVSDKKQAVSQQETRIVLENRKLKPEEDKKKKKGCC